MGRYRDVFGKRLGNRYDHDRKRLGWNRTISGKYVGAQLTTEIIKTRIVHEERPNGLNDESFPSGHASGAFSAPMFIHKRYGWKQSLIPYGLAIFTGFSRVHTRMHYTHDVLAGAAVSALFTWMFVSPADTNVHVWPVFSSESAGVRASVQF